ncbi:MAG: hypothetical protein K1Y36_21390 [Blastocatellia bacterium]|nr:hypothetical protein [Blastocatellia bacterium]
MLDERISVTDWNLLQTHGGPIILGHAFAFVGKDVFAQPTFAWVSHIFGAATVERPHVVSLLGPQTVELPGVKIRPVKLPDLVLTSITCDKALYRAGRDTVHLLVLNPLGPNTSATLVVAANGNEFGRYPLRLGAQGEAPFTLRDLPVGDYEVRFLDAPAAEPACEFTVAEYRLAPLVASLVERTLEPVKQKLHVKLRLESYGTPIEGAVQVDLTEGGRRVATVAAKAQAGLVEAAFSLTGEGPFALNVQVSADPSKTATVPLVGSRAAERKLTSFSTLGTEVQGSLLPSPGAQPVRGIYLEKGGQRSTPFQLERVDTRKVRLTATVPAQSVRMVAIDPTFPRARANAVNPAEAPFPGSTDERYQRGESLFHTAYFSDACAIFEQAREALDQPHPFYAYFAACCYARQGMPGPAVSALRQAIEDGWNDFRHLATDEDLASLRGFPPYEMLKNGGRQEIACESVAAGQHLEFEVPEPLSVFAVGAYVNQKPWEGWAAIVAPVKETVQVTVPAENLPASTVTLTFEYPTSQKTDAALYVIVKDARLLSPDTPGNRLAGRLKEYVESAAQHLNVGIATRLLKDAAPPPEPPAMPVYYKSTGSFRIPMPASAPAPPGGPGWGLETLMAAPAAAMGVFRGGGGPAVDEYASELCAEGGAEYEAAPPARTTVNEPEVLFAGLVDIQDGTGQLTVTLGDDFADYIVETFALSGLDWTAGETRFRAEKDPYLSLTMPLFVHPDDGAVGRLYLSAKAAQTRVSLSRDGQPVPLALGTNVLNPGEPILQPKAEISFLATPGTYEARLEDLTTGLTEVISKQVDPPGKFRRLNRTLCFLEPGQSISRHADASVIGLRVLPGLDAPFTALVDATADYGHACCEQTAAILLSACGMYALAEPNSSRREKAESIIVAGVRREKSMWLPGRGFKMYPDYANEPHSYYGPKAARYLWNLDLLKTGSGNGLTKNLAKAISQGLEMAADTTKAYKLDWPVVEAKTCEDAYQVARFNPDKWAREQALVFTRKMAADFPQGKLARQNNDYYYGAVLVRGETAYAAATLLRLGGTADRKLALALANSVVSEFNEGGRLYSTLDSVAAIALMSELRAANIVGGAGLVALNGETCSTREAAEFAGEIESLAAVEGVAVVEVLRLVEEDWNSFAAGINLRIALEKHGQATRHLTVGDAVDLKVTLEDGYKVGDLLWVCLPEALSRVVGGGQVKLFALDFAGKSELSVPLAATSVTLDRTGHAGPQHFAACVRNMFEEERAGSAGYISVTVAPGNSDEPSFFGKLSQAFRRILE